MAGGSSGSTGAVARGPLPSFIEAPDDIEPMSDVGDEVGYPIDSEGEELEEEEEVDQEYEVPVFQPDLHPEQQRSLTLIRLVRHRHSVGCT